MNLNYLKPWEEEFGRTERFLTTVIFVVASGYTAFTAWDMRTTLEEEGCEQFVKEYSGVNESTDLRFVDPGDRNRPPDMDRPDVNVSDLNYTSRYSR